MQPSARRCSSPERAVEKHINALFAKSASARRPTSTGRVKAVLMHCPNGDRRREASTPPVRVARPLIMG